MKKKTKLKSLVRKSNSPKASAKAEATQTVESNLYTEDLPKGLQIVAGQPLQPGTPAWEKRQDILEGKKLAKAELSKEDKPLSSKIVIDLSKLAA